METGEKVKVYFDPLGMMADTVMGEVILRLHIATYDSLQYWWVEYVSLPGRWYKVLIQG